MTTPRRNILITGAGSGLGRGLAHALSAGGHHVLVTDVNRAAAEQTVAAMADPGRGQALQLDVTRDADVDALRDGGYRVDVLVNNAGLQHVAPLESFDMEQWTRLVGVMLTGTARVTRAVLPGMRQQQFGRIVNIGSIHSLVASPYKTAYVAAKHALLGFAKAVALETADTDITVNTICPAYIRTPLVDAQIAGQARSHGISESQVIQDIMLKPMPKRQFITVEEVAAMIEFLIGSAARNITGQAIAIDGGWTAQ